VTSQIDLVFVSWNRLAYTQHSFRALLENTAWEHVAKLVLADDASTDGTREWLAEAARDCPVPFMFLPAPFGGPVAAVNTYLLGHRSPGVETLGKVDNDTMVPAGWLPELLRMLDEYPEVTLLGMAPDIGPPQPCPYRKRVIRYAPWVDGNGLWRHRAFNLDVLPSPTGANGRFGFSEYQGNHEEIIKAWVAPDIPIFQLDLLPMEPWVSLAAEYVRLGWQRYWAPHHDTAGLYWQWFTDSLVAS
jgi:hypothetical protein